MGSHLWDLMYWSSSNFMMPRFHFEYKLNFLIPEQDLAAQLLVFISSVWLVHIVFNNLLPVTISLHDLHDPTVLICWSDYLSVIVSPHGTCTLFLQTHQLDLPVGKLCLWCTPIIPELRWLRQEDHEFELSLGYTVRPWWSRGTRLTHVTP
jgi:hypothetical protein